MMVVVPLGHTCGCLSFLSRLVLGVLLTPRETSWLKQSFCPVPVLPWPGLCSPE